MGPNAQGTGPRGAPALQRPSAKPKNQNQTKTMPQMLPLVPKTPSDRGPGFWGIRFSRKNRILVERNASNKSLVQPKLLRLFFSEHRFIFGTSPTLWAQSQWKPMYAHPCILFSLCFFERPNINQTKEARKDKTFEQITQFNIIAHEAPCSQVQRETTPER